MKTYMGQMVRRQHIGLGLTTDAVSAGLLTAAPMTGPAAPFVAGAGAIIGFFSQVFSFGYDPAKLNDTAITEAFRISMNRMWNDLTGDNLPNACDPGQCGSQHVAIFTPSDYPNVPYPAGRPGAVLSQYQNALEAGYQDARSKLVRPESVAGLDENYNYMKSLLSQVASRQASILPTAGITDLFAGTGLDWGAALPLIAAGALIYSAA